MFLKEKWQGEQLKDLLNEILEGNKKKIRDIGLMVETKASLEWERDLSERSKSLSNEILALSGQEDVFCQNMDMCISTESSPESEFLGVKTLSMEVVHLKRALKTAKLSLLVEENKGDCLALKQKQLGENIEVIKQRVNGIEKARNRLYVINPDETIILKEAGERFVRNAGGFLGVR